MFALLALALTGCTPMDAEVGGNWFAWLPANTSATVLNGEIEGLVDQAQVFECSGRGWNDREGRWDDGYIGPREDDDPTDPRWFGGDCNPDDSECTAEQDEMNAECKLVHDMEYFTEFQQDGYYALRGTIDPWRTEAIINGEGAFQLTVHVDLAGGHTFLGGDSDRELRFVFSIDPDFAPVVCLDDANGQPTIEYVDGQSWLDAWSRNDEGYTVYYLNYGTYQEPPAGAADEGDIWYMPTEWTAGFGHAKFSADEFSVTFDPAFEAVTDRAKPDMAAYDAAVEEIRAQAERWSQELVQVAGAQVDGEPAFEFRIEDNTWRPVDSTDSGLDGWVELHSSWVRIKDGSNIEPGGSAEGDFQILLTGTESPAILLVRGEFRVDEIREDRWAYENLEEALREENGTPFCGGALMPE